MTFFKGQKFSEETKEKMSLAKRGRVLSLEHREKLRHITLQQWKDFRERRCAALKGWHMSEESKKKLSIAKTGKKRAPFSKETRHNMRLARQNMKFSEEHKKHLSLALKGRHLSQEHRAKLSKIIRPFIDTSIEVKIQNALKENNIVFFKHKYVFDFHRVDLFIEPNICIECDGDYWHKYPEGTIRDVEINEVLQEKEYLILRFWEHEIKNDTDYCIDVIKFVIRNQKQFGS